MAKGHQIVTAFLLSMVLPLVAATALLAQTTDAFVVASYNVENWVLMDRHGEPNQPKPVSEKQAVWEVLQTVRPDVLGLAELGTTNQLTEIVEGLRQRGLDYPFREWIQGSDETRHVALLSRFPIAERHSRTDYTYLLDGKPTRVLRGILDVLVQVNDQYAFRTIVAHLKSKRTSSNGDQAVMRLEEARLLRSHIDAALKENPRGNLLAMGDYNDTPESEPIRLLIGALPVQLFDLMPVDSRGGHDTYYWESRDLFSRIDYLMASAGMSNEYVAGSARIADVPAWKSASDHRAVYASFYDHDVGEPAGLSTEAQSVRLSISILVVGVALVGAAVALILIYHHHRSKER